MSENDQKVRKLWLTMWIIAFASTAALNWLRASVMPVDDAFSHIPYVAVAVSWLGALAFGFAGYHCVYKRPGTKLLTFMLIVMMISLVITPVLYLSDRMPPPAYMASYYEVYLLLSQGMGILWVIVSWKMRKVNKRLQALQKLERDHLVLSS